MVDQEVSQCEFYLFSYASILTLSMVSSMRSQVNQINFKPKYTLPSSDFISLLSKTIILGYIGLW